MPLAGNKGGSNPYQVFTDEHVQMARTIRMAQSLGFSLREIAALNVEYQAKRMTPSRGAEILRGQLARLEEKAAHVGAMIGYIRAKLAWLEAGGKGPEPNFTDYEKRAGSAGAAGWPNANPATRRRSRAAVVQRWQRSAGAYSGRVRQVEPCHQRNHVGVTACRRCCRPRPMRRTDARHNCVFHCAPHPANVSLEDNGLAALMADSEKNRFSARAARYARVGANVGGVAARYAGRRILGGAPNRAGEASALAGALGNLKGPLMKVAQLMATIPDLLPPEYAAELPSCKARRRPWAGPSSSAACRRSSAPDWQQKFASFEHHPAAAASLGQVHRARSLDGAALACKLQYPDMQSAVEADLQQLQWLLAIRRRLDAAIDTSEIGKEIGARVREELDYRREAKHVALYRAMLDGIDIVRVPRAWPELSTGRLLTLDWLEGTRMLAHKNDPLAVRNTLATAMFTAWWYPFSRLRRHPRRSASRQLHRLRCPRRRPSAQERVGAGRHQPARLWLHPDFPAEIRPRRRRSLSRAACTTTTTLWSAPTRPGASAGSRAT